VSGNKTPRIPSVSNRWTLASRSGRLYSLDRNQIEVPESVCKLWEKLNSHEPAGNRTPISRSSSP